MQLKLAAIAVYVIGFCLLSGLALARPSIAITPQQTRPSVGFDLNNRRGVVLFHHQSHEAGDRRLRFVPAYLNKPAAAMSCVVCHHRRDVADPSKPDTSDITDPKQFQNCKNCHRSEGDPQNFYDREGFELSSREAYHRLCVGCHMDNAKGGYEVKQKLPLKCGECHDRSAQYIAREERRYMEPAVAAPRPMRPSDEGLLNAPIVPTPKDAPTGYAGSSRIETPAQNNGNAEPITDRWRIGFPEDPRYREGSILNPYRQNVLKGDYPIFGQHNFLVLIGESESLVNAKRIPVPSNVSSQRPDSEEFFGRGGQFFFKQNFVLSVELFHGDTSFKPVDWRIHITPVFNVNYMHTQENGIVNVDFRRGNTRTDGYISLQEAFGEYRLGDTTKVLPFLPGGRSSDKK
ncbi:MAG TPA: cytochrome c3 family protein, partial [Blastocatellia bacterium]|nr:cytochrome c3 family protein [Blastocatellia bacterium]